MVRSLSVDSRFAGPPRSANGGYLAGRLAGYVDAPGAVRVTLRRPPPLHSEMTVQPVGTGVRLWRCDDLIADAEPADFTHDPVEPVDFDTAVAARATYAGSTDHPFPGCFVCGTGRVSPDGLCLTPGLVGAGRTACIWRPDWSLVSADSMDAVGREFVWAALDCPGGWTSDLETRPLVLGRITLHCAEPPGVGAPYRIVGRLIEESGRKTVTATTMYDEDDRVLGRAEHVWIAIDPARFNPDSTP